MGRKEDREVEIIETAGFDLVLVDGLGRGMGAGRPKGLHLGAIIRKMREAANETRGDPAEQEGARMQLGFLWESAFERAWAESRLATRGHVQRQLSLQRDGIWMTPDAYDPATHVLEEYKLTWKSRRKWDANPERHFWPWLVQIKAYALALETTTCQLRVFWVNDDYRFTGPFTPAREYLLEFTEQELRENWSVVLQVRDEITGGGEW